MNKLPNGWQIKTLGDIFLIERGSSPRPIKSFLTNDNNGINWIKIGDAKNNSKYIYQSAEKIRPEGKKYSRFVEIGDLILSNSMSFGRPYIMKTIGCIHDGWVVLRKILKNIIYEEYAYYILSSNQVHSEFSKLAAGSVVKNLSIDRIKQVYIPIPPLDEQKRIASALSKIDAYLENTIKLIEEKERFKRGIAKKLLTCKEGENIPEARFKGFEDEWMEVAISKIGTIITGNTPSTKNESFWNGNNVWVTPTDIKQKYISNSERKLTDDGLKKSRKLPANTLLITCIASIGKNAILKCEGACNQQINAIIPNKNYNVDFLYYLFENEKSYLKFKAPQSVIKIMSKSEFSKLVFKFPLLEEQEKIGGYLSLLDAEIDNLKKQKELIKEMKRGAMQKLLSGEVRLSKNAFNENI